MRVALVAPLVSAIAQPYLGGAQALLADLAQGLLHRGHSVTLFARNESFVPGIDIEAVQVSLRRQTCSSISSCNYSAAALSSMSSMCMHSTGLLTPAAP